MIELSAGDDAVGALLDQVLAGPGLLLDKREIDRAVAPLAVGRRNEALAREFAGPLIIGAVIRGVRNRYVDSDHRNVGPREDLADRRVLGLVVVRLEDDLDAWARGDQVRVGDRLVGIQVIIDHVEVHAGLRGGVLDALVDDGEIGVVLLEACVGDRGSRTRAGA